MEAGTSPELAFRLVGETVDWYQQAMVQKAQS